MSARKKTEERICARGGFTLIEVLLVVAILGILAGIVVVNFGGQQKKAMEKATRASIAAVCTAIDMYEVDMGQYPNSLDNLVNNPGLGNNWNGPYVRGGKVPEDAWGQPLQYTHDDKSYKVSSSGPPGGGQPITSWEF